MQATIIEVFKTNIQDREVAFNVSLELTKHFPNTQINFDLDDCDKILRIEGSGFNAKGVIETVADLGYTCDLLI